ncbi:hypothetical protein MRX96_048907 [Rhipicephalus microplus]
MKLQRYSNSTLPWPLPDCIVDGTLWKAATQDRGTAPISRGCRAKPTCCVHARKRAEKNRTTGAFRELAVRGFVKISFRDQRFRVQSGVHVNAALSCALNEHFALPFSKRIF